MVEDLSGWSYDRLWGNNPVAAAQGRCGRSQGCFAVSPTDLDFVLNRLGRGRLLYADRV